MRITFENHNTKTKLIIPMRIIQKINNQM